VLTESLTLAETVFVGSMHACFNTEEHFCELVIILWECFLSKVKQYLQTNYKENKDSKPSNEA